MIIALEVRYHRPLKSSWFYDIIDFSKPMISQVISLYSDIIYDIMFQMGGVGWDGMGWDGGWVWWVWGVVGCGVNLCAVMRNN